MGRCCLSMRLKGNRASGEDRVGREEESSLSALHREKG